MRNEGIVHRVYLGLGSNLGNREAGIAKAIELVGERIGRVARQSAIIETEPWGFASEHKFLNGVILCETTLTPRELLAATQQIERDLGRKPINRKPENRKYLDRPIDIDILLYDNLKVDEPDLKIPHPLMHERDFVMIPLNELINNH